MIISGEKINSEQSAQVCIVGSGAAGITLAWELARQKIHVILIDGSRDLGDWSTPYSPPDYTNKWYIDKELLYNGTAEGLFTNNEPGFLTLPTTLQSNPSERERYFGGTSNHWGGQSRPLDSTTLSDYKNYPGWPVSSAELAPYYSKAATLMNLTDNFSASYWASTLGDAVPQLPGFTSAMYQFISRDYLQFQHNRYDSTTRSFYPRTSSMGESLADSSYITVIRNASLLHINQSQGAVTSIKVGSMAGGSTVTSDPPTPATFFNITADAFVLACGAVENAHQLLLSDAANSSKLVGRYFMCQPLVNSVYNIGGPYLSPLQKDLMNGANNSGVNLNGVGITGRFQPDANTLTTNGIGSCWFWDNLGWQQYYFEQAPNFNSYVSLADTVDKVFGLKETSINWAFNEDDERSYNIIKPLFQKAVQDSANINYPGTTVTVDFQPWSYIKDNAVVNGHHLGTTRMSDDPTKGVVNSALRTHDLDNLYIAGSSVWTSAGVSNPTFSIIMFSIRLGEYIGSRLASSGITVNEEGHWTICGTHEGGIAGLKIEAWDADALTKDDLLGSTTTDEHGNFCITYNQKSHKELIFDAKPDLYFKVYDASGKLLQQTDPIKNADTNTKNIVIPVS